MTEHTNREDELQEKLDNSSSYRVITMNQEIREELIKLYNESRQMGMLRTGSPIYHMVEGAMALFDQQIAKETEQARIDELQQMRRITFRASTVVPRVSSDNRPPLKRMDDHINERLAQLSTQSTRTKVGNLHGVDVVSDSSLKEDEIRVEPPTQKKGDSDE